MKLYWKGFLGGLGFGCGVAVVRSIYAYLDETLRERSKQKTSDAEPDEDESWWI